ncbi:MAG: PhoX family phosphatase [Bacteroidetes bacterium]|nr:PhoX family phosphatase [Bacteroidota bacterium]
MSMNENKLSTLEKLINKKLSRRELLETSGRSAVLFAAGAVFPIRFFEIFKPAPDKNLSPYGVPFKPVLPSTEDKFILPEGFDYTVIRKWGDKISAKEDFGFNNDFAGYISIDHLSGGNSSDDGLLLINHEYPSPLFINNYSDEDFRNGKIKTPEEVEKEKKSVGICIIRVKKANGKWLFAEDEKYNRRIDATTPVKLSGKASGTPEMKLMEFAAGTLANCSGGITPWGTLLSGEENFQDYFSAEHEWEYRWNDTDKDFIIEHYGWVVEVDPFDKNSVPKKRTSLGRFRHENVAVGISDKGKAIAYMGDDKVNECVYKFISKNRYDPDNRSNNMDILDEGDLYAADFINNKWQLIDFEKRDELKKAFVSQADVLVNCDKAAKLAGGTECNRPEDIEINPFDKSVFVSFTNNSKKDDYFGSIVRIIEKNNDPESMDFEWEVFAKGGADTGFSCPDNLTFDNDGNLWVLCDISTGKLNKNEYAPFKNNSLFMIPTTGPDKGKAFLFATGPVESEMCGGTFTPDGSAMFLSVQHPGEGSLTYDNPTSRWPSGGGDIPRPAVIAITGFKK